MSEYNASYPKEFIDLINDENWGNEYIGVGNPNAKILIVGKECAINKGTNPDQYDRYKRNYDYWLKNCNDNNKGADNVEPWSLNNEIPEKYNPLYPYKTQLFKVLCMKDGIVIRGDKGTSRTWYNYQKLINFYRERPLAGNYTPPNTSTIDFFKDCFLTEMSNECRPNNNVHISEINKTKDSVINRYHLMCKTPYFQNQFDTVILVCGHYLDKAFLGVNEDIELNKMFGPANIILNSPDYGQPNILRQLSFNVSDGLLKDIANRIIVKN